RPVQILENFHTFLHSSTFVVFGDEGVDVRQAVESSCYESSRDGGTGRRSGLKRLGAAADIKGLVLSSLLFPFTYKEYTNAAEFGFVSPYQVLQRWDSYRMVTVLSIRRIPAPVARLCSSLGTLRAVNFFPPVLRRAGLTGGVSIPLAAFGLALFFELVV